jgi:hypothetical protein
MATLMLLWSRRASAEGCHPTRSRRRRGGRGRSGRLTSRRTRAVSSGRSIELDQVQRRSKPVPSRPEPLGVTTPTPARDGKASTGRGWSMAFRLSQCPVEAAAGSGPERAVHLKKRTAVPIGKAVSEESGPDTGCTTPLTPFDRGLEDGLRGLVGAQLASYGISYQRFPAKLAGIGGPTSQTYPRL